MVRGRDLPSRRTVIMGRMKRTHLLVFAPRLWSEEGHQRRVSDVRICVRRPLNAFWSVMRHFVRAFSIFSMVTPMTKIIREAINSNMPKNVSGQLRQGVSKGTCLPTIVPSLTRDSLPE